MSVVESLRPAESHSAIRRRLWNPPNKVADPCWDLPRNWRPPVPAKEPPVYFSDDEYAAIFCLGGPMPECTGPLRSGPPTIQTIQRVVAREFELSVHDLLAQRRTMGIVLPRQIAMYLCKKLTNRSLPEIGRRFGGKDHTTILHAVRKVEALRKTAPELESRIVALIWRLGGEPS